MLNAGYEPLQIINWQRAMVLWLSDKAEVVEYHSVSVRSARQSFRLPSVIRLKRYIRPIFSLHVRLSRKNVFIRDKMVCQYCHKKFGEKKLTVDHVIPLSRGGPNVWSNVVAACPSCNNRKGDKTPEEANMKLLREPEQPEWLPSKDLQYFPTERIPRVWMMYLRYRPVA